MKKQPKKSRRGFAILFLVIGLLIFTYPFYVNALNGFLDHYQQEQYVREAQANQKQQEAAMRQHNAKIAKEGLRTGVDPFRGEATDEKTRGYLAKHFLGTVTIPKLKVSVNLFDRTSGWLLERGASVVPGTSLPSGQKNTHSMISAHSGLPERKLFTGLDRLKRGDTFLLTIGGQKRAYRITGRQVVLPNKQNTIALSPKEERVTLMTCTPYMVNSHRLLLTGRRVPLTPALKKAATDATQWQWLVWGGWFAFLLTVAAVALAAWRWPRRRKLRTKQVPTRWRGNYAKVEPSNVAGG
ncbi:class C sortase [Schleiferilactobacillus harbinensis]|jgi:sortase A|uniref:class C sortase n=1 Tax=Schleiferilactobacillus harbinensis TaxID=304207 RepID=UPI00242D1759|nr:class C sortase [Schleiferilactobacillus harbinensis]MCI1850387.1 class C sortase [Schleiferilactobacillus harbinensis]